MEKKLMLIAGCREENRQRLKERFQEEYAIVWACDGAEATEKIREYADRLVMILLEIAMPRMNGTEVLKWMAEREYKAIPVVAFAEEPAYEPEALENGARDFILWPSDDAVIRARVNNALGKHGGAGEKSTAEPAQTARVEMDDLLNNIPGGIAVYRMGEHVETLFFTDGVAALSGHTREEYEQIVKNSAEGIVCEADRERLYLTVNEALENGRAIDLVCRICHKNGGLVWVRMNATVILKERGIPIIHAVLQSVSRQDRLYDLLVNQSQNAIYVSDVDSYELLYLNDTAAHILRTEGKSYSGRKCYEYIFGRTEPCPFCKIGKMSDRCFLERIFHSPTNDRYYHLKGKLVDWCGVKAHVEYMMDITAQNLAKEKLKETQGLLTAALHNTNVTVWEYDVLKHEIVQSFNFKDVHGFGTTVLNVPDSMIESGFVHPQSVEDFRELYREAAAGKERAQRDVLLQNADRSDYRWARITYIPIIGEGGRHVKSIGTSMDVTDQKNLEESFGEIESLRSEIANGIMLNISKDRVEAVYSKIEVMQGINDSNMTSLFEKVSLRIPDETQRAAYSAMFNRENLLYAYAVGRTEQFVEARCQYRKNECRILQMHIRLTKSPYTGDIIGYTYMVDVDEQRTMEAVMDKVSMDHFEFILILNIAENTARMISSPYDKAKRAPRFYPNYAKETGRFCKKYIAEEQRESCEKQLSIETITSGLKDGGKYMVMLSVLDRNKEIRVKRLSYSYLNESTGQVLVTAEDITELLQAEQEKTAKLADALELAKKASASKSEFLSNMSHDMRTPMNAILGFSQMALEERADRDVMEAYMKRINESGRYLLNLINDVLDMAKIENKKMDLRPEAVDAQALFGSIISSVTPMMEKKEITFLFEPHNLISGKAAIVDKLHLQQIFVNLLSNAAKFTPRGGRVEFIIDTLSFDGKYAQDRAIIRDNGCGMSREFLGKVFLPFEQERKNTYPDQSGTGLGLAIVKRLVDLMGGTIEIDSTEGVGTEVTLNFTTELVDQAAVKSAGFAGAAAEFDLAGKRVLLCEDHPLNREIAGKLLTRKGFVVDMAENGCDGLRMFESSPDGYYDVVLMDIRMPVMDGLQAAEAVRRLDRHDAATVPIIAMTANAFDDDIQKSMDAGMNAHLSKPIEPDLLYKTLYELL